MKLNGRLGLSVGHHPAGGHHPPLKAFLLPAILLALALLLLDRAWPRFKGQAGELAGLLPPVLPSIGGGPAALREPAAAASGGAGSKRAWRPSDIVVAIPTSDLRHELVTATRVWTRVRGGGGAPWALPSALVRSRPLRARAGLV